VAIARAELPAIARMLGGAKNPALLYLASLQSPESRRTQGSALRVIAELWGETVETLPWEQLRHEHVAALRALLAAAHAPSTGNRYLAAVKGVLRAAWRLGQLSLEAFHSAIDVRAVGGTRLPAGRALRGAELQDLVVTAKADESRRRGARDRAVVGLAYGGGLRRAEIAGLNVTDYDGATVRVLGKGNKERRVPLPSGARKALDAWIEVRGRRPGPLIESLRERDRRGRVRPEAIGLILKKLIRRAGVDRATSHDFRRTFISDLLDRGADLVRVQKLAGHASPATTSRYDRRPERELARAVELLTVPS
jgi:integrase